MKDELPPMDENVVEMLNAMRGGFDKTIGLRFVSATYEEIVGEVEVTPELLQPYGLVHGGVYTTIIESLASTGAAINEFARGRHTVGVDNNTSFLKAVRKGKLVGRAFPLTRGRRTHVWQVDITDDEQRTVATGRVRMICFEHGAAVAGEVVGLKSADAAEDDP